MQYKGETFAYAEFDYGVVVPLSKVLLETCVQDQHFKAVKF